MSVLRSAALRLTASALALTCAAAPTARAETLADAIVLAYGSNPALQQQRAAVQVADETYAQARQQLSPRADLNVSAQYAEYHGLPFRSNQYSAEPGHEEGRTGQGSLTLSQLLYTGGRSAAAINAAEAGVLAQRQALRQAETQLVQQVIGAYTAVRRDQQILDVYNDNLSALLRQLDQTDAEFAVRQVTQTDVDITRGRVAAARNSVANATAQLAISRSQYLALVGQSPGQLAPEPELDSLPASVDAAFDAAEAHNPQILSAQFSEQAANFRVSEAKRQFLPTVQAQISGSDGPYVPYLPQISQRVVTGVIALSQPLYTGDQFASQTRQALAQANEARAQVEINRRTAIQNVSQSWAQLIAARTALTADEAGVQATQGAFYGVRREEPFGLRLPIDVLNAEEELNGAEIRVLQDRYNEYGARAAVLAASGLLEAALIVPDLHVYDPTENFKRVRSQGLAPWISAVTALDGVGVDGLHDPRPPRREDAVDRPHDVLPLPPPPTPAAQVKPFTSATSIIEAERKDTAATGAAAVPANPEAPISRCNLRQSEREGCEPGGPPPAPLTPPPAAR